MTSSLAIYAYVLIVEPNFMPVHEGQGSLRRVAPLKSKDAASFNLPEFCLVLGRITICGSIQCIMAQYLFCYNGS